MRRLVDVLTTTLAVLSALAMALMMLHVTADVAGKYLLRAPIPGTAEVVANYYMIAAVFLPLAWVEARSQPIVVDLFYTMAPAAGRRAMDMLGTVLTIAFYGVLAWLSWGSAMAAWRIGEIVEGTWKVVIWPAKFLLPLGLAIAAIVLVLRLVDLMLGRDSGPRTEPA